MTALHPKHHVHFLHYVWVEPTPPWKRGENGCCCEASEDYGDLLGKKSFSRVKLCRTGKLNRTICRIGNFLDSKTHVWRQMILIGCFFGLFH